MKKTILILVAMMIISLSYGQQIQDKNVPAAVTGTLMRDFPEAKEIKWYMDSLQNYIGNFKYKVDKYNYSISIKEDGTKLRSEADIDASLLLQPILDYLNTNYPKLNITKAKRSDIIVEGSKNTITYSIELQGKEEPLLFDGAGKLIQ